MRIKKTSYAYIRFRLIQVSELIKSFLPLVTVLINYSISDFPRALVLCAKS